MHKRVLRFGNWTKLKVMVKKNTFSALDNLKELSVVPGSVFLGPWSGVDHEKFLVVAGVEKERILVCSVMINSQINQYIMKRPKLLAYQVEIKEEDYSFLSHDSFVNCAQPIKAKFSHFLGEEVKYCGLLCEADLNQIKQQIIASGSLTADEIRQFFNG